MSGCKLTINPPVRDVLHTPCLGLDITAECLLCDVCGTHRTPAFSPSSIIQGMSARAERASV